jgi:uncharacterized protein YciI
VAVYAVTYRYNDDVATRDALRATHREYLAALPELLISGPHGADEPAGALLLFRAGSKDAVVALVEADPFRADVIAEYSVAEWSPVLGPLKDAFAG